MDVLGDIASCVLEVVIIYFIVPLGNEGVAILLQVFHERQVSSILFIATNLAHSLFSISNEVLVRTTQRSSLH